MHLVWNVEPKYYDEEIRCGAYHLLRRSLKHAIRIAYEMLTLFAAFRRTDGTIIVDVEKLDETWQLVLKVCWLGGAQHGLPHIYVDYKRYDAERNITRQSPVLEVVDWDRGDIESVLSEEQYIAEVEV